MTGSLPSNMAITNDAGKAYCTLSCRYIRQLEGTQKSTDLQQRLYTFSFTTLNCCTNIEIWIIITKVIGTTTLAPTNAISHITNKDPEQNRPKFLILNVSCSTYYPSKKLHENLWITFWVIQSTEQINQDKCILSLPEFMTRSSTTAMIARDADDAKQPFKVTQGHPVLCQSMRHVWLPISAQ